MNTSITASKVGQATTLLIAIQSEDDSGFIEIRHLGGYARSDFFESVSTLDQRFHEISTSAETADVYFGVCKRREQKGNKAAVERVSCLWADLDAKTFQNGKSEAYQRIATFPIKPTAIVDSGNGFHLYWRLDRSIEVKGPDDWRKMESYLKAISFTLGSDPAVCDVARILRLPGTNNRKNPQQVLPVKLIECDIDRRYDLALFDGLLKGQSQSTSHVAKVKGWVASLLGDMREGNRNASFAKLIGRLHHDRYTPAEIEALLAPHAASVNFDQGELHSTIRSVTSYPNGRQTTSTQLKLMEAISLVELMGKESPEIVWRIDGILPLTGMAIIGGQSGIGKTWMLLDLAIECARGGKWVSHLQTKKGKVLYVDEESSHMLLRHHLQRLLVEKGITDPSALNVSFAVEQSLCLTEPESLERFKKLLNATRPDLVIVDTLIRVHDAEENSASDMSRVFDTVRELKRDYQCAFLFADHQRKPGAMGTSQEFMLRGSTDKVAAVDTLLSVHKDTDDRIVEHSKSRYGQPVKTFGFRITDTATGGTHLDLIADPVAAQKAVRQRDARKVITDLLAVGEKARKELVEECKAAGIHQSVVDESLRDMETEGAIKREDRKLQPGRGGKQAIFSVPSTPTWS